MKVCEYLQEKKYIDKRCFTCNAHSCYIVRMNGSVPDTYSEETDR